MLSVGFGFALSCNAVFGLDDVTRKPRPSGGSGAPNTDVPSETAGQPHGGDSRPDDEPAARGGQTTTSSSSGGDTSTDLGPANGPHDCDEAGDAKEHAYDFGALATDAQCPDRTFVDDRGDLYRFELAENSTVTYTLAPNSGQVLADFYEDEEQLDFGHPVFGLDTTSVRKTEHQNLEKGVYYVQVRTTTSAALYGLTLGAEPYELTEPSTEPGETPQTAFDLRTIDGLKRVGGYVGKTDAQDYYRFHLSENVNVAFSLNQVNGQAMYNLYDDDDQPGAPKWASGWATPTDAAYHEQLLPAGDYLLQVVPYGAPLGSLYNLAVSIKDP